MKKRLIHFSKRAIAYFIDCSICFVAIMLLFQWAILTNVREYFGITTEWFHSSLNLQLYILTSISLPVLFYFSYFDSKNANGTFGKRLMNIKLVDNLTGESLSYSRSLKRSFLKLLPWEISHLGAVFPTPLYFLEYPGFRILILLGLLLFLAYGVSIILNENSRSIYDKILRTKVVVKL